MSRSINVVLRILCIVFVVVILLSTLYSYCVATVNAFYAHDSEDPIFSSMDIIKILSLDNGKTLVIGTFLQGDDLLSETNLFIKAYDSNGKILENSSLVIPEGYEISGISSNGTNVLIEYSKETNGFVCKDIIQIDDSCNLVNNISINSEIYSAVFTGFIGDDIFIGEVTDGFKVSIKTLSGTQISSYEFTEDVVIEKGYFADNYFYLVGENGVSTEKKDYLVKLGLQSDIINSWVIDDDLYFSIDNVVSTIEGKVYLVGKYFNTEVYKEFYEIQTSEKVSDNAIKPIATHAIATERSYFSALFTDDYLEKPWCSVFLCEIQSDGTLGEFISPIADGGDFGISEFQICDKTKQNSSLKNEIYTIGTISSKMAESKKSSTYSIYCYKFYNNFETSNSVKATLDSSTDCFMGYDAFGRFFVYIGKADNNGRLNYNLKFFDDFESFQEEQNKLNVFTKIVSYYKKYCYFEILGYVFIFILLYATVRFYGTQVKQIERKKKIF